MTKVVDFLQCGREQHIYLFKHKYLVHLFTHFYAWFGFRLLYISRIKFHKYRFFKCFLPMYGLLFQNFNGILGRTDILISKIVFTMLVFNTNVFCHNYKPWHFAYPEIIIFLIIFLWHLYVLKVFYFSLWSFLSLLYVILEMICNKYLVHSYWKWVLASSGHLNIDPNQLECDPKIRHSECYPYLITL